MPHSDRNNSEDIKKEEHFPPAPLISGLNLNTSLFRSQFGKNGQKQAKSWKKVAKTDFEFGPLPHAKPPQTGFIRREKNQKMLKSKISKISDFSKNYFLFWSKK